MTSLAQRGWIFLTGCLFSLIWASAFIAGKVALPYSAPISLLCARFAAAGSLMLVWLLISGQAGVLQKPSLWRDALVLGIFNQALYLGLSFKGLKFVSAEAVVLIVSMAPFFTMAASALLGTAISWRQIVGVLTGFAGVCLVLSVRIVGGDDPTGMLLVLLGTLSFAAGTVWYRYRAAHHPPLALNALQNLAGTLALLPFSPTLPESFASLKHPDYALAFLHLVLLVSILDFMIWLALLRRIGAAQAASFHLLNPVFGIFLAALVFGTPLRTTDLIGAVIVMLGLALASFGGVRGEGSDG
ncbi:MAG: EamA family transporter [Lautropia sp.]|nr:EamA family transporter [Lautropia sp.]